VSRITFNLLGPQGSGKGTQAKAMVEHFGFTHFDIGHQLRKIRASNSELGKDIATYMDHGDRVPAPVIADVTLHLLEVAPKNKDILFDGLLRGLDELEGQKQIFTEMDLELPVIIFLNLDEEVAVQRIQKRRICGGCGTRYALATHHTDNNIETIEDAQACMRCDGQLETRHDDTPEAVRQRLDWYHRDTLPVVDYFRKHGIVIDIDASPSIEAVTKDMIEKIDAFYASQRKPHDHH
jgi:adenylate kinase